MYQPGTVLELREKQSTEDTSYPYDRIKVLGVSPVSHAQTVPGQWQGIEATGVLIQPAGDGFGPNVDRPLGYLQENYEIVEIPDINSLAAAGGVTQVQPGPSPEDVFKGIAVEADIERANRRRSTVLQNDGKTPEQVLAEKSIADKPAATKRTKKDA